MYHPKKVTYTTIEFVDIAGLVRGASRGEGLGNKFLSNIREVDAIVHVVRAFDDSNIVHVDGSVDPRRDIETINMELIFADLEAIEKRMEKTRKQMKSGDKSICGTFLQERIKDGLKRESPPGLYPLMRRRLNMSGNSSFLLQNLSSTAPMWTKEPLLILMPTPMWVRSGSGRGRTGRSGGHLRQIEEEIAQLDDNEKSSF